MSNYSLYKLDQFLYMEWLRPEVVVWHTVAENLIGSYLRDSTNIMEIAIGNGYFTFMSLGGQFTKEFDHYYSVKSVIKEGFIENEDIYDCSPDYDISQYIKLSPHKSLSIAIDHKQHLLDHVKNLNIADQLLCIDANNDVPFIDIDTVYTNSLYWLNEPFKALNRIQLRLPKNGTVILVFPNENFYSYCRSYNLESKMWKMLNRGRADSMMWTQNLRTFEKELGKLNLKIEAHQRYLSKLTLQIDDIGLRQLSPQLIKMANYLPKELRLEIKEEWCSTCKIALDELLDHELNHGPKEGGFHFVVLKKV